MTHLRRCMFILILALWLVPSMAAAQDKPTQAELEEAQRHADQGTQHFLEQEYSKALIEFYKGYEITGDPLFLYNISLAYQKMGDLEKSEETADQVLASPKTDERLGMAASARIGAIEVIRRSERTAEDLAESMERERKSLAETDPDTTEETDVDEPPLLGWVGWTGLVTTGIGAGILGYAAVLDGEVDEKWTEYEEAADSGDAQRYETLRAEIEDDQSFGQLVLYSGIGLASIGLTMFIIDLADGAEGESGSVSLAPRGDGGTVVYTLSF